MVVPPSLTSQQLGTDTVVDAQRTTDTVKDVRSIAAGEGLRQRQVTEATATLIPLLTHDGTGPPQPIL